MQGQSTCPAWADRWLRTTGMDTIDVVGKPPEVAVVKTSAPAASLSRTHALCVGSIDAGGATSASAEALVADTRVPITVPADALLVVPDLHDDTWAKIRFGPDGWSQVAAALPGITDEHAAVVIYNAIRDAVRDAALSPARALDMVCAGLGPCRSDVILASVAGFAQDQLAGAYCPVAERSRAGRPGASPGMAGTGRQRTRLRSSADGLSACVRSAARRRPASPLVSRRSTSRRTSPLTRNWRGPSSRESLR